jgi:hypothetical protein
LKIRNNISTMLESTKLGEFNEQLEASLVFLKR